MARPEGKAQTASGAEETEGSRAEEEREVVIEALFRYKLKFWVAVLCIGCATFVAVMRGMDSGVYADILIWVSGLFGASNVAGKAAEKLPELQGAVAKARRLRPTDYGRGWRREPVVTRPTEEL